MIDIVIDRESSQPIYAQIRDAIAKAIKEDNKKPGTQLPTVSALADMADVTQCTVRRALEDLVKSGDIVSHVGRGTFVCDPAEEEAKEVANSIKKPDVQADSNVDEDNFRNTILKMRAGMAGSLDSLMALSKNPNLLNMASGIPDQNTVQPGLLGEMLGKVLTQDEEMYFQTPDAMGLMGLREAVAERYTRAGHDITPDMVMIVSGVHQALALIALLFQKKGYKIICETPGFQAIPKVFGAMGHWVEHVRRDLEGPDPERLDQISDDRPSLIYICPEFHNPMGIDISAKRRKFLIDWAKRNKAIIIADEIFRDLRFEQPGPGSLIADYGLGKTIAVGSLSKSFSHTLRIGWLITNRARVKQLCNLKRLTDHSTSLVLQTAAEVFMKSGEYDRHLESVVEKYQIRKTTLLTELSKNMPEGVTWTEPQGGFNLWVSLPPGYSSIVLYMKAIELGVSFFPGPYLDIDHRFVNSFRLSYARLEPDKIREGAELLGLAVKELMSEPPGDVGLSGIGDFL